MQSLITFPSPVPDQEAMALRKEHKDLVADEVRTQLGAAIDAFRPHGWRKIIYWAKEWGITGAIITGILTLCAITFGALYQSFGHLREETEFRTKTGDRLEGIEGRIGGVENSLKLLQAQLTLLHVAAVPSKELKNHRNELATVKNSLATVPRNVTTFWPVSFQIITLLSQAQAVNVMETVGRRPMSIFSNVRIEVPHGMNAQHDRNVLLENSIEGLEFYDSVIHFDPSVKLTNVLFVNCVFILPLQENPPKTIQQIGIALLAADLSKVTLTVS